MIFSVANELAGSNKIAMMQAKATGLVAGVSDLIVITPSGKLLFIELKTEKGVQSQVQKDFEQRVTALGFAYHLIRSLTEFKSLLDG